MSHLLLRQMVHTAGFAGEPDRDANDDMFVFCVAFNKVEQEKSYLEIITHAFKSVLHRMLRRESAVG